jgi:hypothetical protein
MLVEQRTYTTLPGKCPAYLALYEAEGLPIQLPILGRLVGYYKTEFGALNQIVHMWAYTDLGEREARRARLAADPDWQHYVGKMMPLLQSMETTILVPAPFFEPLWRDGSAVAGDRPAR